MSQLPHDLEQFIAEHAHDRDGIRHMFGEYIPVDDLRAWMDGHVRVPITPTKAMMNAFWLAGPYPEKPFIPGYDAMLHAAKEEEG